MKFRTMLIGVAMSAIALGAFSAGTANAVEVYGAKPGQGPYIGFMLDHGETVALANSPIPGWLDSIPAKNRYAHLAHDSQLPTHSGLILAGTPEIIGEAAAHPSGRITVTVGDPVYYGGNLIEFHQYW